MGSGRAEETPQRVENRRECEGGEEQGKDEAETRGSLAQGERVRSEGVCVYL